MKKELRKYFNINIYKLEEERKKINDNYILYYDLLREIKEKTEEEKQQAIEQYNKQQEERQKQLEQINDKINIETIEKNLIYNNIIYLFYKNYHDKINNIMEKYKNKNIGEKTKIKIQEEIQEELKKDNIFTNVYFSFGQFSSDIYNLDFTIYETEESQKNYSYNKISFNYNLCNYYHEEDKEKYKNYYIYKNNKTGANIINNNKIWDNNIQYKYIEDTKKESKKILKECKKNIDKVNKLIQQATEIRKEHNILLDTYKIQENDNIKIDHVQNLY